MSLFETKMEKEQLQIIDEQAKSIRELVHIVDNLLSPKTAAAPAFLGASYITLDSSNNFVYSNLKNIKMAQTINILSTQNTVAGQITPVAADGITVEPITTINPGSEIYTISDPTIATVAPISGGTEGQFSVVRVSGKSGTVTFLYTAVRASDGAIITNFSGIPDTFIFQGTSTGVASALSAVYQPAA